MNSRNRPKQLESEKLHVMQFLLKHLVSAPLSRGVPVEDVFEAYRTVNKTTVLTIDGFGRILRCVPDLRRAVLSTNGATRRFILGMKLV